MKIGFIGTGNMGSALAIAAAKTNGQIFLCNRTPAKAEALARKLHCETASAQQIAEGCDYIFLGVKPQMMGDLLAGLAPTLRQRRDAFTLVSMAAGLTMETLQKMAGGSYPVIRMMPNTPVAVGSGVILYDATPTSQVEGFCQAMAHAGYLHRLPEPLIDAGSAVSGCGPAFASMFLEALADGGVACGLPRETALRLAAHTLAGTAHLLLETGKHPGVLKDEVCSPGGSTIQGVRTLEHHGFRSAVIEAVISAAEKSSKLGK
jgi:pyrroline-5-carboxylate reductase